MIFPNRHPFNTEVQHVPTSEQPWCLATCSLKPFEMCPPDRPRPWSRTMRWFLHPSSLPHSVLGNSYSWRARVSEREAETKGPDLFMPCLHSGATPQTSRWLGSSDFYLNIYIIRFRGVRTIAHGPWGRRYCAAVLTHVGQIFKPSIVAIYHDMPLSCFQNYRKNGCTATWQLNGPRCTVT